MTPIYFPFTYISKPVAKVFGACFKQIVVYQPLNQKIPDKMRKCAESGILDIRIPVRGDEKKLNAIVKDYINWANLHEGGKGMHTVFFSAGKDTLPFFDETSMYHIKADIKKKMEAKQSQNKTDPLFDARIFLTIAQEFDMQNMELYGELKSVEKMEQDFLANLKGEYEALYQKAIGGDVLFKDDPGDYMTSERFEAWARLYIHDQAQNNQDLSSLFITSSRAAFEYLIDKTPEAKKIIGFDSIPMYEDGKEDHEKWKESLMEYLDNLANNTQPSSIDTILKPPFVNRYDKNVSFTLYFVPKGVTCNIFACCIDRDLPQIEKENKENNFINTLLGLIEL